MARVTIEDCIKKVANRFELVVLASSRARDLASGASKSVNADDKYPVIALREIASDAIDMAALREQVIMGKGYNSDEDEESENVTENLASQVVGDENTNSASDPSTDGIKPKFNPETDLIG
jgi:DNA-directed RNA polymerase subunit omega